MRILLTLIFISNLVFAQNGKEKVVVTDLTRIKQIGSISVAPDGKKPFIHYEQPMLAKKTS